MASRASGVKFVILMFSVPSMKNSPCRYQSSQDIALLCARRERPSCRRAAERRDEFAPSHECHEPTLKPCLFDRIARSI